MVFAYGGSNPPPLIHGFIETISAEQDSEVMVTMMTLMIYGGE